MIDWERRENWLKWFYCNVRKDFNDVNCVRVKTKTKIKVHTSEVTKDGHGRESYFRHH